jgi:hypothetical protein
MPSSSRFGHPVGRRAANAVAGLAVAALLAAACGTAREGATATASLSTGPTPVWTPSPSPTATPTATATGQVPAFRHVYLIVLENKEYSSIVGSRAAPYLNSLIARYGLATRFYAESHPSEPNYIAMTSGGLQGTSTDGTYNLRVTSLFDQIEAAGRTWHVYAQGYPGSCYKRSLAAAVKDGPGLPGQYVRKHNPAISYLSISSNPTRCAAITGLAVFDPAAADFEMIIPNQYNDMHTTPPQGSAVAAGDAFLKAFMPSILDSPAFDGSVVFITFDEGSGSDPIAGGHIATIVISPGMTPGFRSSTRYSHYSMLRTIEQAWGLPLLGEASSAATMAFPY